jgi:hypothetical protein
MTLIWRGNTTAGAIRPSIHLELTLFEFSFGAGEVGVTLTDALDPRNSLPHCNIIALQHDLT